ncbi:MAG: hypothetical protein JST94_08345 [Bacteroidetes bacterium]|nr:hypothetical protein [Bacteroidota bacterium]MBS1592275.1 hypothetical protein [Bacteroidota bacterium]MBS1640536.1 hypothetical protein [Bacteroidota bacterium]MBS1643354.1 hypothetical protein [Bacteroidota bacterium]MBS1671446.1 hypothetical protein [Bacteroidota bacterium]
MKKLQLIVASILILFITACTSSYGKKIKINDTLEIYAKGDSVTDADAKKLGEYLANLWKDSKNQKSLQLLKTNGVYEVKMVIDVTKLKADSSLEFGFMVIQSMLEHDVFPGSKVKFTITDDVFKPIKSFQGDSGDTSSSSKS